MKILTGILLCCFCLTACLETRQGAREQEEKQQLQKTVGNLQRSTADVNAKFEEQDEDIRKVSSRVDALESKVLKNEEKSERNGGNRDNKMKDLNEKFNLHQDALTKMESQIQNLISQNHDLEDHIKDMQKKLDQAPAPAPKAQASTTYQEADDLFQAKQWQDAAIAWGKYLQNNPKGKHLPEANYKLAVCFHELGQKDEAKTFYKAVIAKYPKSEEAKKAKVKLKKL